MRIEQISVKTLTISLLAIFGTLSIALSFLSSHHNKQAAIDSHIHSMSQVIKISAHEIINSLTKHTSMLSASIQADPSFSTAVSELFNNGNSSSIITLLDDPLINGFVGAADIELVKLRIYDVNFNLLTESNKGLTNLPAALARPILQKAGIRLGIDRLKAISGLWNAPDQTLFSTITPIGGLRIQGYMEIILNPTFNFSNLSGMTGLPISIHSANNQLLFQSAPEIDDNTSSIPIAYILKSEANQPLYKITAYDSATHLNNMLKNNQLTLVSAFLGLTAFTILIALWVFNRFLFRPTRNMIEDMEKCIDHNNCVAIKTDGLKEFHILAKTFNMMSGKIQINMQELKQLSIQDGLTGLANRRHFDNTLEQEWKRALRQQHKLSLLLIDIDSFKLYNDTYGHQTGDECLKTIAATLAHSIARSCDLIARYGGEEFVAIMPKTSAEGAIQVAQNALDEICKLRIPHSSSEVRNVNFATISIGISTITPQSDLNPHILVAMADKALYEAKEHGRNCLRFARHERNDIISVSTTKEYERQEPGTITKVHYL